MARKKSRSLTEYKTFRNRWDYFLSFLFIFTIIVFSFTFMSATKYRIVRVHFSASFIDKVPFFFGEEEDPDESLVMTHCLITERVADPYNQSKDWYYEMLGGSINTQLLAKKDNETGEYQAIFNSRDDWQKEYYQKLLLDDSIEAIHVIFLYLNRSSQKYSMITRKVTLFKSTDIVIDGIAFEVEDNPETAYIDLSVTQKNFLVDLFFNVL